jgi:hypothetical protein
MPWPVGRIGQGLRRNRPPTTAGCGDLIQLAGADPVGAALVLLHLLEGQAQVLGQPLLTDAQDLSAHSDARPDMQVDRIGVTVLVGRLAHAYALIAEIAVLIQPMSYSSVMIKSP